ncbi:hypothetical protein [Streptomyces sp. 5-10]|uniref:hypothetical protein n=1 Tax=Streptomyces sp. 5-10 TaxID=878925 RepID=UPI00168BB721|nr:hypothetical protein [Streptomyces sp. 5-10]MBD3004634.1 hypothetical protein [Streptomyces sp. 5-10]
MTLVTVDVRGRLSTAKTAGLEPGRTYEAVANPDGSVTFYPVRITRDLKTVETSEERDGGN